MNLGTQKWKKGTSQFCQSVGRCGAACQGMQQLRPRQPPMIMLPRPGQAAAKAKVALMGRQPRGGCCCQAQIAFSDTSYSFPPKERLRSIQLEKWKSGRIENIQFSLVWVWLEGWKSGRAENSFVWLKRKVGGQKMQFI